MRRNYAFARTHKNDIKGWPSGCSFCLTQCPSLSVQTRDICYTRRRVSLDSAPTGYIFNAIDHMFLLPPFNHNYNLPWLYLCQSLSMITWNLFLLRLATPTRLTSFQTQFTTLHSIIRLLIQIHFIIISWFIVPIMTSMKSQLNICFITKRKFPTSLFITFIFLLTLSIMNYWYWRKHSFLSVTVFHVLIYDRKCYLQKFTNVENVWNVENMLL